MLTRLVDHDDSGSLTDGTPHDNAWLQRLNDTIDARWTITIVSATGTVNGLDIGQADLVLFTNTADLLVNGMLAPSSPAKPGKPVRMVAVGAGHVRFAHRSGSAVAGTDLWNFVSSAPTPIGGGGGSVTYVYSNTYSASWFLVQHEQGPWITPPYAAANFTGAGGMTWTVDAADVATCAYNLRGRSLTVAFMLASTSVGGTPSTAFQILNGAYGGFVVGAGPVFAPLAIAYDGAPGTQVAAYIQASPGSALLQLSKAAGNAWAAATNGSYFYGQIVFEVQ